MGKRDGQRGYLVQGRLQLMARAPLRNFARPDTRGGNPSSGKAAGAFHCARGRFRILHPLLSSFLASHRTPSRGAGRAGRPWPAKLRGLAVTSPPPSRSSAPGSAGTRCGRLWTSQGRFASGNRLPVHKPYAISKANERSSRTALSTGSLCWFSSPVLSPRARRRRIAPCG